MYGLQSPGPLTSSVEDKDSTTESPVSTTSAVHHSKKISRKQSQLGSEEGVPLRKIDTLYDNEAAQPSEHNNTYGANHEVLHAPDFVSGKKTSNTVSRGIKGGD